MDRRAGDLQLDPPSVARLAAALARQVAPLHASGVVHGGIDPAHVAIGMDGEPVLGPPVPGTDLSPADDVADIGALALALLDDDPLARLRGEPSVAEHVRQVAGSALDPDPAMRPAAPELATRFEAVGHRRRGRWRTPRIRQLALLSSVALVVGGAVLLVGSGRHPRPVARPSRPAFTTSPTTTAGPCPVVTAALRADVDDDGCDDPITFESGVMTANRVRYKVGDTGDIPATGRWGCAPKATVALLRPNGDVDLFSDWARPGHDVTARLVGHVAGADRIRADDLNGDGCDDIVVSGPGIGPVALRR